MRLYWLIWFVVTFGLGFLIPETYCLVKGNGGTLSETIWWLEGYRPGESTAQFDRITDWSAGHVLVSGVLTLLLVWLIGHFDFRLWH